MQLHSLFFVQAILCCSAFAAAPLRIDPPTILTDIERFGAKATVQKLNASSGGRRWDAVMNKIATGDRRWLAVAAKLVAGTDAGSAEGMRITMAQALINNPAGVLRLTDTAPPFEIDGVCGVPFIEATHDFAMRYMIAARRALRNLHDPEVEQKRMRCLVLIEQYLSEEAAKR